MPVGTVLFLFVTLCTAILAAPISLPTFLNLAPGPSSRLNMSRLERICEWHKVSDLWNERRARSSQKGVVFWECRFGGEGCGGNADRLRGISGALFNAIRIGYDFAILWDNPVDMKTYLVPRFPPLKNMSDLPLHSNSTLAVASFDHKVSLLRECEWNKFENVAVRLNELYPVECGDEDDLHLQSFFFTNKANVSDPHWNRYPCLGCVFWYLFSVSFQLQSSVEHELELFIDWTNAHNRSHFPTVAIHFRGGDHYMNVAKESYKGDKRLELTSLHKMIRCADKLSSSGPPTIFLCADSTAAKEYAISHYGHRLYTSNVVPFHSDRGGIDPGNGTLGSWTDILLLALADGIVLSSSGYGVLAAQIGMYDRTQVITSAKCLS